MNYNHDSFRILFELSENCIRMNINDPSKILKDSSYKRFFTSNKYGVSAIKEWILKQPIIGHYSVSNDENFIDILSMPIEYEEIYLFYLKNFRNFGERELWPIDINELN